MGLPAGPGTGTFWSVDLCLPLWCINIEEAKPWNLLPFHSDSFPMRSKYPRKLKKYNPVLGSRFQKFRPNFKIFYGVYLFRDDNAGHLAHECIAQLRHYQMLIGILSKSLESENQNFIMLLEKCL